MVERNEGKPAAPPDLRIAIAREVLSVMVGSQDNPLALDVHEYAKQAVALADALLEALGEGQ